MKYLRYALALLAVAVLVFVAAPAAHAATLLHGEHSWPALGALAVGMTMPSAGVGAGVDGGTIFSGILPRELEGRLKRAFFAPLRWAPIAAGTTAAQQLLSDVNHDFVVSRMAYTARDAGTLAIVAQPPLFVEISLASGVIFTPGQQQRCELDNLAGTNRGALDLLVPIVIPAGEVFTVLLTNGTAATNLNVQLDLFGLRAARTLR